MDASSSSSPFDRSDSRRRTNPTKRQSHDRQDTNQSNWPSLQGQGYDNSSPPPLGSFRSHRREYPTSRRSYPVAEYEDYDDEEEGEDLARQENQSTETRSKGHHHRWHGSNANNNRLYRRDSTADSNIYDTENTYFSGPSSPDLAIPRRQDPRTPSRTHAKDRSCRKDREYYPFSNLRWSPAPLGDNGKRSARASLLPPCRWSRGTKPPQRSPQTHAGRLHYTDTSPCSRRGKQSHPPDDDDDDDDDGTDGDEDEWAMRSPRPPRAPERFPHQGRTSRQQGQHPVSLPSSPYRPHRTPRIPSSLTRLQPPSLKRSPSHRQTRSVHQPQRPSIKTQTTSTRRPRELPSRHNSNLDVRASVSRSSPSPRYQTDSRGGGARGKIKSSPTWRQQKLQQRCHYQGHRDPTPDPFGSGRGELFTFCGSSDDDSISVFESRNLNGNPPSRHKQLTSTRSRVSAASPSSPRLAHRAPHKRPEDPDSECLVLDSDPPTQYHNRGRHSSGRTLIDSDPDTDADSDSNTNTYDSSSSSSSSSDSYTSSLAVEVPGSRPLSRDRNRDRDPSPCVGIIPAANRPFRIPEEWWGRGPGGRGGELEGREG